MRKGIAIAALAAAVTTAALTAAVTLGPGDGTASSHREAPLIAEDPSADLTDVYAFRSPDKPSTVTILANVIPGEDPAAGPNWYTFSPNARYSLKIDTSGDVAPDVTYHFQFQRKTGQFFLGEPERIEELVRGAGFADVAVREVPVVFRAESWTEYRRIVSSLAASMREVLETLDDAARAEVDEAAKTRIEPYRSGEGYELPGVTLVTTAG